MIEEDKPTFLPHRTYSLSGGDIAGVGGGGGWGGNAKSRFIS